ncbi:hypothetical protein NLG97_g4487 [Lecanicillium saksenae]|uniref:Uncharacterized protein n=1 Tax=Lecanicillium saksenae TaxID=468837 RepID=A0ACC1QXQ3_9HYPO|nr:hypothetical protein NLG97_g4487 [Lecanicillium saksenae]
MLSSGILGLAALASTALGATVSYDTGYDDGSRSLLRVACSDGDNGLISRYKWKTQAEIPRFPYIGGASAVAGWNSPNCGTCWKISYRSRSVTVLAVDHADAGFNIGLRALNELTGGRGVEVGRIEAEASQVDVKQCGL